MLYQNRISITFATRIRHCPNRRARKSFESYQYAKTYPKNKSSKNKQIFIATHSDLISARLDLRKTILLNSNNITSLKLTSLPEETAKFFMKSPDNNILRFILSKKVILVEGDAEYILMEAMYRKKHR